MRRDAGANASAPKYNALVPVFAGNVADRIFQRFGETLAGDPFVASFSAAGL